VGRGKKGHSSGYYWFLRTPTYTESDQEGGAGKQVLGKEAGSQHTSFYKNETDSTRHTNGVSETRGTRQQGEHCKGKGNKPTTQTEAGNGNGTAENTLKTHIQTQLNQT
jgi:hypothetical protein